MEHSDSFLLVTVALRLSDFNELSGSTGEYTYFRHADGRIVQISRTQELAESQLTEIADQAKIGKGIFLDRIETVRKYMQQMAAQRKSK